MIVEELNLDTQYISEHPMFENGTPSGYIIYKTLCGLGATHGEALLYERNSIILLPNTPVLVGKKNAKNADGSLLYPNICIVYEDIKSEEIEKYLNDDSIQYKKILCTPEAYKFKVRHVINQNPKYNLFKDFFMLIDECDSLVKTVFFRGNITSPLVDFFKFEKKAMISATPLKPSDPRFEGNNFRILKVVPQFDYKKNIDIIHTNNIRASLGYVLELNGDKQVFIFLNSTNLIAKFIKKLDIENDSRIFCSEEKVRELKRKQNIKYASSKLDNFKKYNFFTSRFFSAVDIKIEEKPALVMVTDLHRAPFSLLDPYSDSIQISGRLRNGFDSITHITNIKPTIEFMSHEEISTQVLDSTKCYNQLVTIKENETTLHGKTTATEALEATFIHKFFDEEGKFNHYADDCYHLSHLIRSYYQNIEMLGDAYINSNYFIPKVINRLYDADDDIIDLLENEELSKSELCRCVASLLFFYSQRLTTESIPYVTDDLNLKLRADYPEIARIFEKLGFLKMKELEFNEVKMNAEIETINTTIILNNTLLIDEILSLYVVGQIIVKTDTKTAIKSIYQKYGMQGNIKSTEIKNYYEVKHSTTNTPDGKKSAWKILGLLN